VAAMNLTATQQTEDSLTIMDRENPAACITGDAVNLDDWQ